MKSCQISCLAAALLLVAGCNIQFNAPVFPQDTSGGDVIGGDTGIDGVVPDGVEKTCAEFDGICADPTQEDLNSQGCPWGYELMPEGTCTGDNHCCTVSPSCEQAGTVFTAEADGLGCCPGLSSFDLCAPVGFGDCGCSPEEYVCTDCGNGACEEWENPCICLVDCPWGGNECKENGGACMSACPPGHEPMDLGGCEGGDVCCFKEGACLGEGQGAENGPGSLPCCEPLTPIAVTEWGGGELGCQPDNNWYVCTNCGNGTCENWESLCTCPQDCEIMPNICEEEGGMCMEYCPDGWSPVYTPGCDDGLKCCMENEYECIVEGGNVFPGEPGESKVCCEGLVMINNIIMGEEGECSTEGPGMICSYCGIGGVCDEPWENECNCPGDCPNFGVDPIPGG